MEHSRSPSVSTPPAESHSTWISTWRAGATSFSTYVDPLPNAASASALAAESAPSSSVLRVDHPHALSATSGRCLEEHREPSCHGCGAQLLEIARSGRAGYERDARRRHRLLGANLVSHLLDDVRRRPDEGDVVVLASAHELCVLGEEAVARVNGVAARGLGGRDDVRDAQVAVHRCRRADADGLIGELDVQRVAVGRRVDGDGLDAELVQRADHADGDLASIRNEHAFEHVVP